MRLDLPALPLLNHHDQVEPRLALCRYQREKSGKLSCRHTHGRQHGVHPPIGGLGWSRPCQPTPIPPAIGTMDVAHRHHHPGHQMSPLSCCQGSQGALQETATAAGELHAGAKVCQQPAEALQAVDRPGLIGSFRGGRAFGFRPAEGSSSEGRPLALPPAEGSFIEGTPLGSPWLRAPSSRGSPSRSPKLRALSFGMRCPASAYCLQKVAWWGYSDAFPV